MAKKKRNKKNDSSAAIYAIAVMVVAAVAVIYFANPMVGTATAAPSHVEALSSARGSSDKSSSSEIESSEKPSPSEAPSPKEKSAPSEAPSAASVPSAASSPSVAGASSSGKSKTAGKKSSKKTTKKSTKKTTKKSSKKSSKNTTRKSSVRHRPKTSRSRNATAGKVSLRYDGIDVSRHQGWINWSKVARNKKVKFVYIKATEGATRQDVYYKNNLSRARKAGLKVGSYHYMTAKFSAHRQFQNFKKTVKKGQQDLIPMIDIEKEGMRRWNKRQIQDSLQVLINLMKKHYGKAPIIYSQYNFYNNNLAPRFNKYYLFIARYHDDAPPLKGHGKYNIWQYTQHGRIPGIDGYVDLDRFVHGSKVRDIMLRRK